MFRLIVLLSALVAVAIAGQHGWSSGGHSGGGGGGGHSPHGGWGGHKYVGWANVNAWQNPHGYQYALNEQGSGYNKYAWAQAEFKGHGGGGWQG